MLIIGAKGFAKEVLEIFYQRDDCENLVFYDDLHNDVNLLYDKFAVLHSVLEAKEYFENIDNRFTIAIGNPLLRNKMYEKFRDLGGTFSSSISLYSEIGSFGISIGDGCNILSGVKISNDVTIGKGCLIYYWSY